MSEKNISQVEDLFIPYLDDHKKLILKVARAYCQDEEERKDLVQDIILQLWKSFPNYDETYALSTWTYRIAFNVSISYLRKVTTREKIHRSYQRDTEFLQIDNTVLDEKLQQLYRFIDLLKPINKAIMIMHLDGCSNKEIAGVMGISESNVSTKKQRIKDQLKNYFQNKKN